jgi:predicted aspartyl protease
VRTIEGRRVQVTVDRDGARQLVRSCIGDVCTGSWNDGTRRWSFGLNEILLPEDLAYEAGGALVTAALAAAAPVPGPIVPPSGPPTTFAGDGRLPLADASVPVVPCTLNGRNARCLLDSGSTPSALALPFAEALGLEPTGELDVEAFGAYATGVVAAGPLVLGAARFEHLRLAVAPTTASSLFDVLVGADLLARLHVELDRAHGRARVTQSGAPAPNGIPLQFRRGLPMLDIELDGRAQRAVLDTGDAALVSLGYATYRDGPQWPLVARRTASGIAGSDDAFDVTIPRATVGSLALGAVRATVRRGQRVTHVGIGLWSRCLLSLDEAAGRLSC